MQVASTLPISYSVPAATAKVAGDGAQLQRRADEQAVQAQQALSAMQQFQGASAATAMEMARQTLAQMQDLLRNLQMSGVAARDIANLAKELQQAVNNYNGAANKFAAASGNSVAGGTAGQGNAQAPATTTVTANSASVKAAGQAASGGSNGNTTTPSSSNTSATQDAPTPAPAPSTGDAAAANDPYGQTLQKLKDAAAQQAAMSQQAADDRKFYNAARALAEQLKKIAENATASAPNSPQAVAAVQAADQAFQAARQAEAQLPPSVTITV